MRSAGAPDPRTYLFSLEQIGIKLGLEQINALLGALNRPDQTFPSIIVAGTNGKGSTSAMIERGLRAAGFRTGRYTSPHLVHIEERIAIDGAAIHAATFDAAANRVRAAGERLAHPPTFFEATTALALDVFRESTVDIAVLEVGLGGRLDATNAVAATAAVITSIDFDHEAYLGNTIEGIAGEKAGVIKTGQVVVLAENPPAVVAVVKAACDARQAALVQASDGIKAEAAFVEGRSRLSLTTPMRRYAPMTLGLRGRHQVQNAITAIRALEVLDGRGALRVPEAAIRTALEDVEWPARLELRSTPRGHLLIDGAHNPAGARTLAAYVNETYSRPLPLVLGVMADKNLDEIVRVLGTVASHIIATAADSPRAARPEAVASAVSRVWPALPVSTAPDAASALHAAEQLGETVVVAGSLFLAGEVRNLL